MKQAAIDEYPCRLDRSPDSQVNFVDPFESLSTPSAREALSRYSDRCAELDELPKKERRDFIDHANRVVRLTYTYGDGLLADTVYDVAILHDVADRLIDEDAPIAQRQAAAFALADYMTTGGDTDQSLKYFTCLLADMDKIENAAKEYRRQLGGDEDNDPRVTKALIGSYHGKIESEVWAVKEPVIDIAHLRDICKEVNIESLIVKAAEAIDNLMHPGPRPAALLQDIIEAETFYAPLCEVLGLDAMASKLRSEAAKRRLEGQGRQDVIKRAEQLHLSAARFGIENMFGDLFNSQEVEFDYVPGLLPNSQESSYFRSGTIGGCLGGNQITCRVKSVGSLAKKILRDEQTYGEQGREPMDIYGMTVVVNDESELAATFANTVATLRGQANVEFVSSPSKEKPIIVQGPNDYVYKVTNSLLDAGVTDIETPSSASQYRVSKLTCIVTKPSGEKLPMEVQFLTISDRKNARIGRTAHIVFKQQKESNHEIDIPELVQFLHDIYDRKHHIDKSAQNVNKRSVARGDRLLDEITDNLELVGA